jgi:hypothetical protein
MIDPLSPKFPDGKVFDRWHARPSTSKASRIWLEASGRSGGAVHAERDRLASNSVRRRALLHLDHLLPIAIARGWLIHTGTPEKALDDFP